MLHGLRTALLLLALLFLAPPDATSREGEEDPAPPPSKDEGSEPQPGADPPADEPPAEEAAPTVRPGPAGTLYLEAAIARIGTRPRRLGQVLAKRPADIVKLFLHESPEHAHVVRPYYIARYELSNSQYLRFLQDHRITYDTSSGSLANLNEIAAHLLKMTKEQREDRNQVAWRQFYFANKTVIWEALKERLAEFQVKSDDGEVDEERTAEKIRFEPLPRSLQLEFYSLAPPNDWPDMAPPPDRLDHPVRYVTYNDAEKLAEWAGMHIPTEYEWEWAARGPEKQEFPWGEEPTQDAVRVNWRSNVKDAHFEATTLPVDSRGGASPEDGDGDGRSWCGAHHMAGNVAEWTSSWFEPYPGNENRHNYMGRWVKVIRGGSAIDAETIVLRSACRNFTGAGYDAPPYPENSFTWVGLRFAAYLTAGRDQIGPIVRRVTRSKKVKEHMLDTDRFHGAVTRMWAEPGATAENHVYVLGRANSIVFIPLRSLLWEVGMELMRESWKKPSRLSSTNGLKRNTNQEDPFFSLGTFHTDVTLEKVLVRKPVDPAKAEKEKKRKRGRRGKPKPPETMEGRCPPGTYVLTLWHGRLALASPSLDFVCFLPNPKGVSKPIQVQKLKADEVPLTSLQLDPVLDWADLTFAVPVGGKTSKIEHVVIKGRLNFEIGRLEAAGRWEQATPEEIRDENQLVAKLVAEAAAADEDEDEDEDEADAPLGDEGEK